MNSNKLKIDQKLIVNGSLALGIISYALIVLTGKVFSILNILIPVTIITICIHNKQLTPYSASINSLLIGLFSGVIEIIALMTLTLHSYSISYNFMTIIMLCLSSGILIGAIIGYLVKYIENKRI